jgi:membrane protein YdbS with pleckstrin-like domain
MTVARVIAGALWFFLAAAVVTIVVMVWHPWVTPWTGTPR